MKLTQVKTKLVDAEGHAVERLSEQFGQTMAEAAGGLHDFIEAHTALSPREWTYLRIAAFCGVTGAPLAAELKEVPEAVEMHGLCLRVRTALHAFVKQEITDQADAVMLLIGAITGTVELVENAHRAAHVRDQHAQGARPGGGMSDLMELIKQLELAQTSAQALFPDGKEPIQ